MTVLPPRDLRHPPPNTHPPIPHQPRTLQTLHTPTTNLLPPQIILPATPRLVPKCPCNTQFLAFLHHRSALRAVEFCSDSYDSDDEEVASNSCLLVSAIYTA
jgi:hypothetical protein